MKPIYREDLETCPICGGVMKLTKIGRYVTGAKCEECKTRISLHRSIHEEYLFSEEDVAIDKNAYC